MSATRQHTLRRGRVALAVAATLAATALPVVLAACGGNSSPAPAPTVTVTTTAAPSGSASAAASASATPSGATTTLSVYLLRPIGGSQPHHGPFIATAHRAVAATRAPARAALNALLAGPTAAEKAIHMTSAIPAGTTLRGLTISGGVATVDLSDAFLRASAATAAAAEVVYTVTQFPTVSRGVLIKVDGAPLAASAGGGPARQRTDYEAVTPPIFVESPAPFDAVTSPVRVSGTADVFEATFQARLLDATGRRLAGGTMTATSGSGTRGTFAFSLALAGSATAGRLVVYDASAEDGSPLHTVNIPLTLSR